jgi:hypothetical protein
VIVYQYVVDNSWEYFCNLRFGHFEGKGKAKAAWYVMIGDRWLIAT